MRLRNFLLILFFLPVSVSAQREASVHGKFVYMVSDDDHITLRDAKLQCIEKAKAEAIKAEFGEMVISDVVDLNMEASGSAATSYFWENTAAMSKGEWLGDTKEPEIDVDYNDGKLVFTAEVWGMAREILQARTELDYSVLKDLNGQKGATTSFQSGERVYLKFRAPSDGYLAVYLTVGDGETSCLLPYAKDTDGRFPIKAGRDYILFDKETDALAQYYRLKTKHKQEINQLVLIFSPNVFTKCNDMRGDAKHPNSLTTADFQKWLMKCQRSDHDMVVNKKWIKISNAQVE